MFVYCVYLVCIYKYTQMHIFKKNMLCLYIKYIYVWYNLYEYKYIHLNTYKIYAVCLCLYIHNKFTQYTHINYVNKNLFWMWLIVWQH